jgi:hypothetical protein
MHEKPSDERAHSHPYRFFPSAMHLDETGSVGHCSLTARSSMREIFYDFTNDAITSL